MLHADERNFVSAKILNLTLLYYKPELVQQIDPFDRKIILTLMESSSSATALAEKTGLNRKTARIRLRKLKRLDVVKEKASRNSMFSLSDDFLKVITEGTKLALGH